MRFAYGSERGFLCRAVILILPGSSSQTLKCAYRLRPYHLSEMNLSRGARFPCRVVDVVVVTVDVEVLPTTTADGLEATVDAPAAVIAVTSARRRWSTSALRTPYVRPAVPGMLRQSSPLGLQRCQMRRNDVGVGVHVPFDTVSSSPTRAVPETAGRTVFFGPSFESTTSLGSEVADPFPSAFVAVTTTRSVCDTSPAVTVSADLLAPLMLPHAVPSFAQRCH